MFWLFNVVKKYLIRESRRIRIVGLSSRTILSNNGLFPEYFFQGGNAALQVLLQGGNATSRVFFQGGNATLRVFFQGADVTSQVFVQGGYKYFFRVQLLRFEYFFRVEMRRQNALGRQGLKPKADNVQVLSAAAPHRHPGLKTVLKALQVYRQACSKGTVQTNPANFLQQRTGMI